MIDFIYPFYLVNQKMKTKQDQRWIAINGSVFVEQEVEVKADLGKKYKKREAVAFNVGQDVAEHIVKLHNSNLSK